ncbi:MAG: glycosyltransferase family A protein [Actinomycetes bacterium]
MNFTSITNSPIGSRYYRRWRRLTFLFAALRTRSLAARDELAGIATGGEHGVESLLKLIRTHNFENPHYKFTKRKALFDLAWLLSNQAITEKDLANAWLIYDYALQRWGFKPFNNQHMTELTLVALRLGDMQTADTAIYKVPEVLPLVRWAFPKALASVKAQGLQELTNSFFILGRDYTLSTRFLKLDVANPFRGMNHAETKSKLATSEAGEWLQNLSGSLLGRGVAPLEFAEESLKPLDALIAPSARPRTMKASDPKVSVVISTYMPDQHLFTAVKSALAQTYQNLEVLVIDDASGVEYTGLLDQVQTLDPRVRVLHQAENGGTYRIRNRALDEATGDLVTFQDSDDWMHPQRLELQVDHLLRHPKQVANSSMSTRLTDRLEALESNRRYRIGICEPSLLFWREKVRDRIGYFDTVRKGGDTEYRKRINKAFGVDSAIIRPYRVLTIQRADNGGLTQGELGFRWIAEFRTNHRDSFLYWHSKLGKAIGWRIERTEQRAFYAPRLSRLPSRVAREPRAFDVVVAANFRDPVNTAIAVAKLRELTESGKAVGALQLNSMYPVELSRSLGRDLLDLLNANKVDMVYAKDQLAVGKLELLAPSAWLSSYSAEKLGWAVTECSVVKLAESKESWVAQGRGLDKLVTQLLRFAAPGAKIQE